MAWLYSTIRSSFSVLFSTSTAPPPPAEQETATLEEIRDAMLEMVARSSLHPDPGLVRRIRYATDVQALWFLRSELMLLLAFSEGEVAARQKLATLSAMFADLLPQGLRSRPSPLVNDEQPERREPGA